MFKYFKDAPKLLSMRHSYESHAKIFYQKNKLRRTVLVDSIVTVIVHLAIGQRGYTTTCLKFILERY